MKIYASGGLVYNSENRILLLESSKLPFTWVLPGGKIEKGEDPLDTLHREIHEETSLIITDVNKMGERDYISPAGNKYYFYDFQAYAKNEEFLKINHESTSYIWIKPKDISKYNTSNSLNHFIYIYHDAFISL